MKALTVQMHVHILDFSFLKFQCMYISFSHSYFRNMLFKKTLQIEKQTAGFNECLYCKDLVSFD